MDDRSAWAAYWRDARGAACQADEDGRYRGVIARLWRDRFRAVNSGDRILDLATGNGAVIELAVECLSEAQLPVEFVGIDSAGIRPRIGERPRPGVRCSWHAGVSNESLPFTADAFDGVASQYGVEYGELDPAVNEAARVLKPGGWLHWICHWREGDLARDAAAEAAQARELETLNLPGRVADLIRAQVRDGSWMPDSHRATAHLEVAQRMREALGKAFTITGARPGQEGGNLSLFLHNLAWLYQHREQHAVETVLEKLAECAEQLRYHEHRLTSLVNAALTPERLAGLTAALAGAGLDLLEDEAVIEPATGRTVGYRVVAVKPGPAGGAIHAGETGEHADAASRRPDWHWSEYWRRGALTTFDQGRYQSGYDGEVAAFWDGVFDALPDGAVMVDLATGNGAIPLLAVRRARSLGRHWTIIGLDHAGVRIPETGDDADQIRSDLAAVDLRPHTPMERTGLPDRTADLVSSQFGIEYGDLSQALSEAVRILKRPGRLALVMHHPDSAVVRQAYRNMRQTRICLDEERLDRKIADRVRAGHQQPIPDSEDDLEQSLERIRRRLQGEDTAHIERIISQLMRLFDELRDRPQAEQLAYIEQCSEAMTAYLGRMESMAAATLDEQDFAGFLARLETAGFTAIKTGEIRNDTGDLIGRTVTARLV